MHVAGRGRHPASRRRVHLRNLNPPPSAKSDPSVLSQVPGIFLGNLPAVIVFLVAIGITLAWRARAPRASCWALAGFGLLLILSLLMPVAHRLVARWALPAGGEEPRLWAMQALSGVGSLLYGLAHLPLLAAIFAGRTRPGQAGPGPGKTAA